MDFTTIPFPYKTKRGIKEQEHLPQGDEMQFGMNVTESSLSRWSWGLVGALSENDANTCPCMAPYLI